MQGEVIKQFLVGLGFDVDQSSLSSFTKTLGGSVLAVTAIGTAINAAGAAVVHFVSEIAGSLDSLSDFAELVGEDASAVSELEAVATIADSSVAAVRSSLQGLSSMAGQAALGVGRGAMVFKKLGIEARDASGNVKTASALMAEVGDRIKGLSHAEQIAFTSKLGIDPTLIKTLTGNYEEIRAEHRKVYESLGVDINKAAAAGSDFVDSQNRLKSVLKAIYEAVGVKLMPQIRRGMDTLREKLIANLPRIADAAVPILDILLRILEATVTFGGRAAEGIGAALGWFNKFNNAAKGIPGIIIGIVAAWKLLNLSFLASPIGAVIALATGIGLLVDDYLTWKEGGKSLIDWSKWGPQIEMATKAVTLLGDAINFLADGFISLVSAGAQLGSGVISKIAGWFGGGAGASLTPSPAASAALGGNSSSLNQKVEINVAGATDPAATGRAVGGAVARANADAARNLQGATR
jgi:hypothetical protein